MFRLFRAVKDESREIQYGILHEQLQAGLITDYDDEELKIAYIIYKDIIEYDIKDRTVSMDILKIARDPSTALVNIVEKSDCLDTEQMNRKGGKNAER